MKNDAPTLEQLVAQRIAVKAEEDAIVATRRAIDALIADMLRDPAKTEGSVTKAAGAHKVTATYSVSRKVDTEALRAAWNDLTEPVQKVFAWKAEVSVRELRNLPSASLPQAAKFFESKPGSTSIEIKA